MFLLTYHTLVSKNLSNEQKQYQVYSIAYIVQKKIQGEDVEKTIIPI